MKTKKTNKISRLLSLSTIFFLASCAVVPITGRRQFAMFPESQMIATSLTQYDQFLTENKLSTDTKKVEMIKRVGAKISVAVEQYLRDNGLSSKISGFKWEFNLVDSDVPNAWCMPGGKVVFYTGILPFTQTEAGVAVVMGHEIAHAIAKHGNERMSQQMGVQAIATGLQVIMSQKPAQSQQMWMSAFGMGSKLGMLKFSRTHESEADKMGLVFMAMAGYNPNEAVNFWGRMAQGGGASQPEFMSTHPADQTRINDLKKFMPEALKYYKK